MKLSLLRKWYNIAIISFAFLSSLFGGQLLASPGDHVHAPVRGHAMTPEGGGAPVRIGHRAYFTPQCPIIAQNFNDSAVVNGVKTSLDFNGATSDTTARGWYLDASKVPNAAYFSVKSHRLKAQTLGGEGVWYSRVFSIAGYTGIQFDAKVSNEGSKSSSEYVKIYHKLNGGPEILDTAMFGNMGTPLITSLPMTGSTIQIVIRIYDTTAGNSEYYIEQYDVFKETGPCTVTSGITVNASAAGALTCSNTSTTLTASTTATGTTTYSWTGPGAFTGSGATVTATTAGTYTVTGTNSAGTGTATVTVTSNTTAPAAVTATSSGTLTCTTTSVTLTGASTTTGVTFSWTGPGTYTATGATATATAPGTYTVTARNTATGCTATASTTVAQTTTAPASVTATSSGTLTCTTTSVTLTGASSTTGVSFAWTGPGTYTATGATATATAPGTYTVTARNTATGCTATASTTVAQTTTAPAGVTATSSGTLTCTTTSVTLTGASSTTGVSFAWTGPGTYTATGATATATAPGTYTVTARNTATGCTATASTTVAQTTTAPAGVTATSSGTLTCTATSVTLTGASTTTGVTFTWTGPGTYTATGATATATAPGTYTVTARNTATGCTATASTTVAQTTTAPAGVTATSSGTLTCSTNFISLSGSSTTTGVSFLWAGPNNFSVPSSQTNVFNPGTYTLTVTNTATGCTATATVTVGQNIAPPALAPIAPSAGTLTCSNPSITLTGSSSTAGVSYSWSGPNSFTATGTTVVATSQGSYILTVTDPSNGCTNTTTAAIGQNFAPPAAVSAINNGPLTCATTSVTLTGSSSTAGVTYGWTGPNGFTASGPTTTTSAAGTYTLTVRNPVNGCTSITNTVVAQSTTAPANLLVNGGTGSSVLTCVTTNITLTAGSTTTGVSYKWTGPNSFSAASASISVSNPGAYLVTATDPSNGCSSNASANVTQNITPPASLLMASNPVNAVLTCSTGSIAFTASSSAPGATYTWAGPNGFQTTGTTTTVNTAGTYTIKATDPVNGCFSTSSAIVTQDTARPAAVATSSVPANATLTCSNTNVVLTGSSSTSGVTYSWTGPGSFNAAGAVATVTIPGNYTVTVTNRNNGCFTTVTAATVLQNTTVPGAVSASASDKLSCNNASVILTGSSTTTGVTYAWAGPNGYTALSRVTTVSVPGAYTVTATDPTNGCSFSRPITVVADLTPPASVTASSDGSLDCTVGSVTLTGNSITSGVTYTWTGPNGFFDPEQVTSVTDSGTYFLTVSNPGNGCTKVVSITVTADYTACSMVTPKAASGKAASLAGTDTTTHAAGTSGLTYKVYPNPISSTAFVDLRSPGSTHVTVEVYNGLGIREKVLFDGIVEAGVSYHWPLDASRLTAGMHYCIIRTDNKVYTSKLLIAAGRP